MWRKIFQFPNLSPKSPTKIFPVLITGFFLLIFLKTVNIRGKWGEFNQAYSSQEEKNEEKAEEKSHTEKSSEGHSAENKIEPKKTVTGEGKNSETKAAAPPPFDPLNLSESEYQILLELDGVYKKIQEKEEKMSKRQLIMDNVEKRIAQKSQELNTIKEQLDRDLRDVTQQEKDKINSLVKIYEAMNPEAAAAIWDEMNLQLVTQIAGAMQSEKLSQILALVKPEKAVQITQSIAKAT